MQWIVLALGLTFPGAVALVDCANREPGEFEGGAAARSGWLGWLALSVPLCTVGVGYGIVLGYYYGVVRRNSPMQR